MAKARSHRRRTDRLVQWRIYGLVGGIALLAVALVSVALAARHLRSGGGVPDLSVGQTVIDFGTVRLGTPLSFAIPVKNVGTGALRFYEPPKLVVREGC